MTGFRAKAVFLSLFFVGAALPCVAQEAVATPPSASLPPRTASFIPTDTPVDMSGADAAPVGLALAPPAPTPVVPEVAPTVVQPVTQAAETITKVESAPLPEVSPEAIGATRTNGLGDTVWKGTHRAVVERLLTITVPTRSPVLNDLVRRLLVTAAAPPEGVDEKAAAFTSLRVAKLAAFADSAAAWDLAQQVDAKWVDDTTFRAVAEAVLAEHPDGLCKTLPALTKKRSAIDWQKSLFLCQVVAKDNQAAQVSLDVLRAQTPHDDLFLQLADKNILNGAKTLPSQMTPLSASVLGGVRLTDMPLPDSVYEHPDLALAQALLNSMPKHDENRLAFAERLAERGLLNDEALMAQYKAITFKPEDKTQALSAVFSGGRLRALLFQAALDEKDNARRVALAAKFFETCTASQANRFASLAALMLGDVKPDVAVADHAASIAQILLALGKGDAALAWGKLLHGDDPKIVLQKLWPQLALAEAFKESMVADQLTQWVEASLKTADSQSDAKAARDTIAAAVLLLEVSGMPVPDAVWGQMIEVPHNEKHVSLSPVLMQRLHAAAGAGRRGETILSAAALVQDGEIALPMAIEITHALCAVGLKAEAVRFAQQNLALLASKN